MGHGSKVRTAHFSPIQLGTQCQWQRSQHGSPAVELSWKSPSVRFFMPMPAASPAWHRHIRHAQHVMYPFETWVQSSRWVVRDARWWRNSLAFRDNYRNIESNFPTYSHVEPAELLDARLQHLSVDFRHCSAFGSLVLHRSHTPFTWLVVDRKKRSDGRR